MAVVNIVLILASHHDHLILVDVLVGGRRRITWFLAIVSGKLILILQKCILIASRLSILIEI